MIGAVVCICAVIMFIASVVAILDPVGTKMADDSDPFGEPSSKISSAVMGAASFAVGIGGIFLAFRRSKKRPMELTTGDSNREEH